MSVAYAFYKLDECFTIKQLFKKSGMNIIFGWMDGQKIEWVDEKINGWAEPWMDNQMEEWRLER